jgi:hypothetical protein
MIYAVTISIVIILILLYLLYVNVRKLDTIESIASDLQDENENLIGFIGEINERLYNDYEHIKQIDRRGSFESDDEVGFVFVTLKSIIEDSFVFVNNFLNTQEFNEEEKESG